ncbi:MAG: hypothetical protein QXD03_04795 [Candidatus Anstonellales archaeon]
MDKSLLRSYINVYYKDFLSKAKEYIIENILEFVDDDVDLMKERMVVFTEAAVSIYTRLVSYHIGNSIYFSEAIGTLGKVALGTTGAYVAYNLAKALKDEFDKKIAEIERDKVAQKREVESMKTEIERLKNERRSLKYGDTRE